MINRKALQAKIGIPVPQDTIDLNLVEQKLNPESEFDPENKENVKGIDLALAGVIWFILLSPKSVRELDYQLTQQDADDLLNIRKALRKKHGLEDDMYDGPVITDLSDTW
ncbi:hypothetical protein FKG96_12390 [Olivibacter sp. LS-1]|uniref:DUF6706 family protein n=1 Tax=Olivibacter sp. LS-1 TaxID=2592345 RepID=UPI0011EB8A9E|nr:DUF6706 family protein [Olivibacter sp. LS-1]QEL01571.1 hypothetical protein FKG96_12390 [Olivibacter sp. LS-1]